MLKSDCHSPGLKKLAVIKSNFLLSELGLFFDAGVAYNKLSQIVFSGSDPQNQSISRFVMTTGVNLRVNLFGAIIIEPYYALPLLKGAKPAFGINLVPGW